MEHDLTFAELTSVYEKWLDLHEDPGFLRMMYGSIVANDYDGLPIWLMVLGPPGSGKSELLMSLSKSKRVHAVSALTPYALASGYDSGNSLLFKLKGKILVVKDLSSVTEGQKEDRNMMFSMLRDAYDGSLVRATGRGEIRFEGKFGMLAAGTSAVEAGRKMEAMLGERFIYVRLRTRTPDLVTVVMQHTAKKTQMREEITKAAAKYLDEVQLLKVRSVPLSVRDAAEKAARFIAKARTPIQRDAYHKGIDFPVDSGEVPTRLFEQINMLMLGMRTVEAGPDEMRVTIARITQDNIPIQRAYVMRAVAKGIVREQLIVEDVKMSQPVVSRILEDLRFLEFIEKDGWDYKVRNPMLKEVFCP